MEQKYEDMFTSQMKIIYHDYQEKSRTTSTQSVNNIHLINTTNHRHLHGQKNISF